MDLGSPEIKMELCLTKLIATSRSVVTKNSILDDAGVSNPHKRLFLISPSYHAESKKTRAEHVL